MNLAKKKNYGQGPLFVITNFVYVFFMNSVLFILCNLLFFIVSFILKPTLPNMLYYFITIIPMGPALSALIYSTTKFISEKEASPAKHFFHGYKRNFKDSLKLWIPLNIILFIFIVDLQDFYVYRSGYHSVMSIVLLIAIVFLMISGFYALLINTHFVFRTKDVVRLSFHYLFTKIKASLGNIALIIIFFFVATITSTLLIILLSSVICYLFVLNSRSILEDVKDNYVKSH